MLGNTDITKFSPGIGGLYNNNQVIVRSTISLGDDTLDIGGTKFKIFQVLELLSKIMVELQLKVMY